MSICCVVGCTGPKDDNEVYFEFPTSRLLRKRWLDAINEAKVAPDSRICCKHFTEQDYEMVRGKIRLKGKVVPTLFVGKQIINNDAESSQDSTETSESNTIKKNDNINNHNVKTNNHNAKVHNDNGKSDNDNGKSDNDDGKRDNDNGKSDNDDGKSDNDNGKSDNDDGKSDNEASVNGNRSINKNSIQKSDLQTNNGENENNLTKRISNELRNSKEKTQKKSRFKITPKRIQPVDLSEDSTNSSDSVQTVPIQPEICKEDIEGLLTNYLIENKKTERQVASMTDALLQEKPEEDDLNNAHSDPVFIELSVGQEGNRNSPTNDCLMVLESVQCEIDPSSILAARDMDMDDNSCDKVVIDDDDDDNDAEKSKPDPISLLTSSDEDDVIIQEPKIDTVEVSSAETDEDDVPLVKLLKKKKKSIKKNKLIAKVMWGSKDFYCIKCRFTCLTAKEYNIHVNSHNSKVINMCSDCGFTTSSEVQLHRHKMKHKNTKRYKCDFCKYTAKHSMSLVYHMKSHKNVGSCKKKSEGRDKIKKYSCNTCSYKTERSNDLKRHMQRKHKEFDSDEDVM